MPWGARTRFSMVDPMTRFLNRIATPLTTSLYLVSLLTGLALFLHIGPQGLHPAHEWLSLLLVLPFALHLWRNWRPFTAYLRKPVMAVSLVLGLIGTGIFLLPAAGAGTAGGPPQFALARLVLQQSPENLAPLLGQTPKALVAALAGQGITITDPSRPLAEAAEGRDDAALAASLMAARQP